MKALFTGLAVLLAAEAIAGAAFAQDAAPLTLEQFQASRRALVLRADTDHDGRISAAEWALARKGGRGDPARQFARLDLDHDGFLTAAEIDKMLAVRFARLDANRDGVLSQDERAAAKTAKPTAAAF